MMMMMIMVIMLMMHYTFGSVYVDISIFSKLQWPKIGGMSVGGILDIIAYRIARYWLGTRR